MGVLALLFMPVKFLLNLVENLLFVLINCYDTYCYSPLQDVLSPIVAKIPRAVHVNGIEINIFTANIVSWTRTVLVIPVALCLKYDFCVTAFMLVIIHDFLDHLDGIVAKVQKKVYGPVDDPILGSFMDAFCDKIVNVLSLWTILTLTDFSNTSGQQILFYLCPCALIIAYEFVLGIVRVQDYFQAYYMRQYNDVVSTTQPNLAAVMEGKLKEKLESLGIAFLCLAHTSSSPLETSSGITGTVCLALSIRLAHASLEHKLKARQDIRKYTNNIQEGTIAKETRGVHTVSKTDDAKRVSVATQVDMHTCTSDISQTDDSDGGEYSDEDEKPDLPEKDKGEKVRSITRSLSVPSWNSRVDKVYTIGCFDLFHEGHIKLLERLRGLGKQVIVGVHDSRSILKLKKRVPIDGTTKRMANVKKHADIVFCVHGTDPTPYLVCAYDENDGCTSMYVRGDDMPDFPARKVTEKLMPIKFLPYTQHVSSTKIRKDVYNSSQFGPHVLDDDHTMFY